MRAAVVSKDTRSVGFFPLRQAGETVGLMILHGAEQASFDGEMQALLQRMVDSIAFGLEHLASELRYRQTFELSGSGIAHVSLDGRFLRANPQLCRMLGYAEEELVGRTVKDVSHPEDKDVTDEQRLLLHKGETKAARFEKRYIHKDGTTVWTALTVALARDAYGAPAYEISMLEDITNRKREERLLQLEHAVTRCLAESDSELVALKGVIRAICEAEGWPIGRYFAVDGDGCLLRYREGWGSPHLIEKWRATVYRRGEGLSGWVWEKGEAIWVRDITKDGRASDSARKLDGSLPGGAIALPVVAQGRTLGVLSFSRAETTDPDERLFRALHVIASQVGQFLQRKHAELVRQTHLRFRDKVARLGELALAKRDTAEVIEETVQTVLEALHGGAVAYLEASLRPRELVVRAVAGLVTGAKGICVQYGEEQPLSTALCDGSAVSIGDEGLLCSWAPGMRSAHMAPVRSESGICGALCGLSESLDGLGEEEQRFLSAAANILSTALQRITSEQRLAFFAQFDALTRLPNRTLVSDRLTQMIGQAARHGTPLAVLFIDLDDFKLVNDTLGHGAGDELLKETARRLSSTVRADDTVGRISGDEFVVLLRDLTRAEDAALVAQKIIDCLAQPFNVAGNETFISASIGIATYPTDGGNPETLLAAADAAMYRAKQTGRNSFQFFTAEIDQRTRARASLATELRRALERREFVVYYQPKIDFKSRLPCGAEALLRWSHPERGLVSPAEFIPLLEEMGLIVPVGEWVLGKVCEDVKALVRWPCPLPIAVNLSARQFRQPDLDARIRGLIEHAGIQPGLLELEITESQLMHDPQQAIRTMQALRTAGIEIAIDDFGTGYSSLAYLTRFPVSALKIDRSFVKDMLHDKSQAAIVRTIIEMAQTLGFKVVAEGVETSDQADFLASLGCEQGQGYLFARPMPVEELMAFVSRHTVDSHRNAAARHKPVTSAAIRRSSRRQRKS